MNLFLLRIYILCITLSFVDCEKSWYSQMTDNVVQAYQRKQNKDYSQKEDELILEPLASMINEIQSKNDVKQVLFDGRASSLTAVEEDDLCSEHINMILTGLQENQQWARQMLDAMGRIGNRILEGNTVWRGSYDECKDVRAIVNTSQGMQHVFNGLYCNTYTPINPTNPNVFAGTLANVLSYGICVPDTCSADQVKTELVKFLDNVANVSSVFNTTLPISYQYATVICQTGPEIDDASIVAIVVLSILVTLALFGTVYDIVFIQLKNYINLEKLKSKKLLDDSPDEKTQLLMGEGDNVQTSADPGTLGKLILSFSLYSNAKKILNTSSSSDSLTAVNGIRFLSITWVVLGHTYSSALSIATSKSFVEKSISQWSFQAISNASVSVDSFFALSGLLLSYLTLKEMDKRNGKLNWVMFYFHRFWRLTPPYMLVLLMDVGLVRFLADGPLWPEQTGFEVDNCKDTWWWNLLYINNFEIEKNKQMCMGWSWYLANDMQFFILSPLMLIPLYYLEYVGVFICGVFILGTWIATGVISSHYGLPPSMFGGGGTRSGVSSYMQKYYFKPYCRMGPYVVGILAGYLLFKLKGKCTINRVTNLLLWSLAIVLGVLIVYGLHDPVNNDPLSAEVSALYNVTHRTIWGACVCWVIFACATGHGGFINTLLSWKAFIPLARLSYCVYLVHLLVIAVDYYSRRSEIFLYNTGMVFNFLGILFASNLVAFLTSLLFEAPMMGMEKVIFRKSKNR